MSTQVEAELVQPMMSGFCAFPETAHPDESHSRCRGGNRARPSGLFQPCPCPCHFPEDRYECENCGGVLAEAPHWPFDSDGDVRYTHLDRTGVATGEDC